ncbi:hypothetical protein BegalDRAFT_3184 [Beggiatoa alba B18LD]|uniref:Uncharacterized protein n=1 Tax=Beggiatoa alba B18LD TaxID=395493 RepID=I3CK65_9GAMM|nr:hypothetical protein [Beggiatoa alba]EIJ44008.1 hypothetical protein BegalDRAFT_3184 [Beggiatoa alba B18LD]
MINKKVSRIAQIMGAEEHTNLERLIEQGLVKVDFESSLLFTVPTQKGLDLIKAVDKLIGSVLEE